MSDLGDDDLYDEAEGPRSMVHHRIVADWDDDEVDGGVPPGFTIIEP